MLGPTVISGTSFPLCSKPHVHIVNHSALKYNLCHHRIENGLLFPSYTIKSHKGISVSLKKPKGKSFVDKRNLKQIVYYHLISLFQCSCFFFASILPSKEQQRPVKTMSVWEQRANQLRRHNQASCEALYDPEECVRLPSGLHIREKTHLDRPLVVGHSDGPLVGGHKHHRHKPRTPEEAETAADPPSAPNISHHRHHCHRDRDRAKVEPEPKDNDDGGKEGRKHIHHSHSKNNDNRWRQEGKCGRSCSKEGSRKHNHHSSMDDNTGGGATSEKEHRHHHSHRQSRGGNGTLKNGGRGERRVHHKDGQPSNKDGDREGKRRGHHTHGSRSQSRAEGEDSNEREESNTNR